VIIAVILIAVGIVAGCFVVKKRKASAVDNESNNPLSPSLDNAAGAINTGTLQRGTVPGAETKLTRTAPNGIAMVNNNSTIDDGLASATGVMSTVSGHGAIGGSSNGIAYDRSHVTGASSSTTSSSNFPRDIYNPPPSPATTVANRVTQHQQMQPRQHQSMHSLPRTRHRGGRAANRQQQYMGRSTHHISNPPPPPTPYSTDFNEESDYGVGMSSRPHFPSAANSTHGGYESSDAYAEHLGYNHPPPSTPQYYSDYNNEEMSCPPSPTPEENTFFLTQPPPSPVPEPLEDDENDLQ
jgi:hypothetical protein